MKYPAKENYKIIRTKNTNEAFELDSSFFDINNKKHILVKTIQSKSLKKNWDDFIDYFDRVVSPFYETAIFYGFIPT